MVFSPIRHLILLSTTSVSIIRVYYSRPSPLKSTVNSMGPTVSCCCLHFSFLIIIYCFLAYVLLSRHIHPVLWATSLLHEVIHIHQSSCPIRFIFFHPPLESKKKAAHAPPALDSAPPFRLIFAPGVLPLCIVPPEFFPTLTSMHG